MGRILPTLLTLLCFTACTTLQPLADAQPATIQQSVHPGDSVEVELKDGNKRALKVESVDAGFLQGTEGNSRYRIALGDIRSVSKREMSSDSKLWIGLGIAAALVAVIAGSGGGGGGGSGY